ncbi:hypothetical protein EJ04DRAFT_534475 [Polyplosphaeria fusca]|uniref:RNA polymerase II degradation factor 1 n=1 Tax=Polyplosphaeria fusca TaxID=682080 RepID=A0A9P4R1C7_9PLEO|nr:hypothetical protein EJ04DRAFT_534475 [Polyplosphaeria fusca]
MVGAPSRPAPRGRSSARGGRGGRGPRPNKQTNGDHAASGPVDTSADQGELGELKKRYKSQLSMLKELFPDWTDADLVLAVEESDGDLEATIEKISEGNVSQFAEVKKTKDRSRSKVKDATGASATTDGAPSARGGPGGRGRGGDSIRGGRGRGTERGRGGFRGARGGATNGTRSGGPTASVPTMESPAWDAPASTDTKENETIAAPVSSTTNATEVEAPKAKAAASSAPAKKTWASMFAAPKAAPAVPKPKAQPPPPEEELAPAPAPAEIPAHEVAQEPAMIELPTVAVEEATSTPEILAEPEPESNLTPSKDELTKDNVEHLPDVSHPPATETAASTVASSRDIGQPIGRPGLGGYATTALKATSVPHQAVVMPGNHAVDRAAVQFGSMGLNGDMDADALDVDEDREEAETRTQPPQHSPAPPPTESQPQESIPTPKQAPGLPPPQQQPLSQQSPSNPLAAQVMQNQGSQGTQPYNQFGRYAQGNSYDPFGQQQSHNVPHSQPGSSGPEAFGSQYMASEQPRNSSYTNYYNNYNQQNHPNQQEAGSTQQRAGSGFSASPAEHFNSLQSGGVRSQHSWPSLRPPPSLHQVDANVQERENQRISSLTPTQVQKMYNDSQNSGHTTPNPALSGQHPSGPASQSHVHQQHAQQGQHGGYPYSHPYYGSPYYANYMNQFGGYGQGAYGGFGGGKNMYGQPHHYGMSPQSAFDHNSSSPANAGGFGASHGRDGGLGGGLGDYGRSASGASQSQHGATAGGFGGFPESFGRSQGGYPNQSSSYGQQQGGQQGGNEDSLKPFGDSKSGGPSPSALGTQPGRPGSATNNTPGQGGQGLPPQSGFGGYPSHVNQMQGGQGNQYGGLGGLGHQGGGSHQAGGYASYSGFGGGYNSYNRGGWGNTYGHN